MKDFLKNVLFGLVIIGLSLLPFIWLRDGYIYMSEEDNFGNYKNVIYRNAYSWTPSVNKGNAVLSNDHIVIIPAGITYYFFSSLGISNDLAQRIYLSSIMLITFASVIYMMKLFTSSRMILLAGVLFYYFNFYVKSTTFYSAKMYQLLLMPLFFTFLYKYLATKKYIYVALNFLFLFTFQAIFTNLATLMATIIFYPIAVLYHATTKKMPVSHYLKYYSKNLAVFFMPVVSIFFYNLLVYYYSYISSNTYNVVKQSHTFSAISAPINAILQLRGAWWETAGFEGVSYNPWLWYYNNPVIVFGSFLLILGMLGYSIYKKNIPKKYFFWFIMFLAGILFSSGSSFYQPIFKWFFINVPLFYIFREPWAKFMPVVILSGTVLLVLALNDFKKKYIVYIALLIIILRGVPFFTPDFFDYTAKRGFIPFAKIPTFWKEYEEWTLSNRNETILSLPIDYYLRNWYTEDLGNINHPLIRLFGYSNIIYESNNNNFGYMLHYFVQHQNPAFIKVANIDYALVQKDIDVQKYPEKSRDFTNLVSTYFQPTPSKSFGEKLLLHRIKPEYATPLAYIPDNLIITGGMGSFLDIISKDDYSLHSAVFLKSQNREKTHILRRDIAQRKSKIGSESIEFTRVNPTKYTISLRNIKGVTPIIFNQNYHPEWRIYPQENNTDSPLRIISYFIPQKDSESHYTVNGYANAWFINPKTLCIKTASCKQNNDGTYDIDMIIEYFPNRLFTLGLMVFGVTSIGVLVTVMVAQLKKNK